MKIPLLIIILITTTSTSIGQIQLLKNYHFEKGGYSIIGTRAESDPNGLADSLGEFYTNDINVLNSFKKEWIFKKPSPQYSCGYHFIVSVCKDGFPIESFDINLNCNVIATDKGYFYFDSRKLRIFKGKLEKPVVKREKFSSVQEARAARNKMLSQRNLIMTYEPSWTKYEGEFNFTYTCRKGTGDCLDQGKKIIKQLTQEIKKAYPIEEFELEGVGGSKSNLSVNVKCNKTLSENFKLYPRGWGKWEPYQLSLISYWKK